MTRDASPAGGAPKPWGEVDAAEKARHEHTAAVAQRITLTEATILLDAHAARIAKQHPGRRRGSLSVEGQKLYDVVKACADMVHKMRDSVLVRGKEGPPYVPSSVHDRKALEAEVERQVPGTYPRRAASPVLPAAARETTP